MGFGTGVWCGVRHFDRSLRVWGSVFRPQPKFPRRALQLYRSLSFDHAFDHEFDYQATLIIRHPTTTRLFVNFDREILQLIRETKLLQRSNVTLQLSLTRVGSLF